MKTGSPEDFVGHPVSDPGESVLIEKEALEGFAGMAFKNFRKAGPVEGGFVRLGREVGPPGGGGRALVKADATEFAVIGKDEGGMGKEEDKMVVLSRDHLGFGASEVPGHAQVETEPGIAGEPETELFPVGLGLEEAAAREAGKKAGGIGPAENPRAGMEMDGGDRFTDGEEPLFAEILDFGKFWHGGNQKDQRKGTRVVVPRR